MSSTYQVHLEVKDQGHYIVSSNIGHKIKLFKSKAF